MTETTSSTTSSTGSSASTGASGTGSSGTSRPGSGAVATTGGDSSALVTEHGKTTIADAVVAKIAGIAAREVNGVHNLGGGAARAVGALRDRFSNVAGGSSPSQGVSVEVGERQAAVDLSLVAEYGVSIADLADGIRRNVISSVERMTGLTVTEVNIDVQDVYVASDDDQGDESSQPRVQ